MCFILSERKLKIKEEQERLRKKEEEQALEEEALMKKRKKTMQLTVEVAKGYLSTSGPASPIVQSFSTLKPGIVSQAGSDSSTIR